MHGNGGEGRKLTEQLGTEASSCESSTVANVRNVLN